MLIEFRVENHRSIRDEQVLSMEAAVDKGEKEDLRPRTVKGYKKNLLPVACIYGANASGKSNVLSALAWMRDAVDHSSRTWEAEQGVPRKPFAWGMKRHEPSMFEVQFIHDDIQYRYGFATTDWMFEEEWLFAWPKGKKQTWFVRDNQQISFGEQLRASSAIRLIEQSMRPNSLFLSTAIQLNLKALLPITQWFGQLASIPDHMLPNFFFEISSGVKLAKLLDSSDNTDGVLDGMSGDILAKSVRSLLTQADLGISDFKIDANESDTKSIFKRIRFLFKHVSSETGDSWLPLAEESGGTQTLFRIAFPILKALSVGGVFFIDELESSLHPSLARYIVDLFNDPETNPKNAQLIFTTHDTNLLGNTLGEPELRRDEVWLTEKDKDGATVLYPLTEFKPRKDENMERGYLQGRYGAIPFLGNFSLAGE